LRTQQILAYETGVADVVDPLAGSYYVESLTNAIEEQAQNYIKQIDALGGSVRAIERGFMQAEIEQAAYEYQHALEEQRAIVVGVNRFVLENEARPHLMRVDPTVGNRQVAKLADLRQRRDNARVQQALAALERGAAGTENLWVKSVIPCAASLANNTKFVIHRGTLHCTPLDRKTYAPL